MKSLPKGPILVLSFRPCRSRTWSALLEGAAESRRAGVHCRLLSQEPRKSPCTKAPRVSVGAPTSLLRGPRLLCDTGGHTHVASCKAVKAEQVLTKGLACDWFTHPTLSAGPHLYLLNDPIPPKARDKLGGGSHSEVPVQVQLLLFSSCQMEPRHAGPARKQDRPMSKGDRDP